MENKITQNAVKSLIVDNAADHPNSAFVGTLQIIKIIPINKDREKSNGATSAGGGGASSKEDKQRYRVSMEWLCIY